MHNPPFRRIHGHVPERKHAIVSTVVGSATNDTERKASHHRTVGHYRSKHETLNTMAGHHTRASSALSMVNANTVGRALNAYAGTAASSMSVHNLPPGSAPVTRRSIDQPCNDTHATNTRCSQSCDGSRSSASEVDVPFEARMWMIPGHGHDGQCMIPQDHHYKPRMATADNLSCQDGQCMISKDHHYKPCMATADNLSRQSFHRSLVSEHR